MPQIPIIMPQLGESIAEATIVTILVQAGDEVSADQEVLEVETNKAVMGVTSPCAGRILEWKINIKESYPVGCVLGYVEATAEEAARLGLDAPDAPHTAPTPSGAAEIEPATGGEKTRRAITPTVRGLPVPASAGGASYMSPRMKARMAELGLHAADLSGIAGSGAAGRVTIEDLEKFLAQIDEHKTSPASPMRVAVADAMRRSCTRPLATVGIPAVIDALLKHRKQSTIKAGPALYALRALGVALGENSAPAGRLIGERIIHPPSIDIGFAVEAEDGVLVPVLRDVDRTPLADLVLRYNELVELARQRRIPPALTSGSIATVTNFGTFGLIWATPIPLPEQTLVLGLGAGRVMPHWNPDKGQFEPVTEAYLTLSFDHRVLDGGAAGRLLQHIVALMMAPEAL
jgi:pyruvate/2-oxoglutarate dehydrogenase complex dihydrolipoamide acyltransferase (E2) component